MNREEYIAILETDNAQLKKENKDLQHQLEEKDKVIAEAIEYMNSLEFFDLMNSKTNTEYCPKDKAQCEDYFKAKEKLVSILQGKEVE